MAITISQMCGNGASLAGGGGAQSTVKSLNGVFPDANGDIKYTAENLGAALAGLNIQTVTKAYRRYIAIEGNEDKTPAQFLWAKGKGSFFIRHSDGLHFVSCVDVSIGLKARLYIHIPAIVQAEEGETVEQPTIAGGIYIGNAKVAGLSSNEELNQLLFTLGDSPISTLADLENALANYATNTMLTNALMGKVTPAGARNIAKDEFVRTLPLTAVGSTYLEKIKEDGKPKIKIIFGCNDWLHANFDLFEKVELCLYICHRRHGLKYHWRHPLNWNETSTDPEKNRYGYATIAGMERDEQHYPNETFPAIPRWMQHNGYMETKITLKKVDAKRGYYIIDPSFYFLPMLKPADCTQPFTRKNIEFMGTQPRTNTARRHLPTLVTWCIECDGKPLGMPKNTLRVGCSRISDSTSVANDSYQRPGYAYLANPYLKIE